jgi:hypothetical protein
MRSQIPSSLKSTTATKAATAKMRTRRLRLNAKLMEKHGTRPPRNALTRRAAVKAKMKTRRLRLNAKPMVKHGTPSKRYALARKARS